MLFRSSTVLSPTDSWPMQIASLPLATIAGTLLLTSCSLIPAGPDISSEDAAFKQNIEALEYWRARGKFSYRSSEVTETGNFDWRQRGQSYQLRLFGPLGMGSIKISGGPNLVRIQTGDQDISSDQPLSLLYRMTGIEIPLNSMPMWLTGKPASRSPSNISLDDKGRIQSFFERQWLLNYSDYREVDGRQVPTAVAAYKDGINLRMLVHTWKADQAPAGHNRS